MVWPYNFLNKVKAIKPKIFIKLLNHKKPGRNFRLKSRHG